MLTAALLAGSLIFYGPEQFQCLALTADSATSAWTVTGAVSHYDAINDTPDAACLYAAQTTTHDGTTTMLTGPASTTCSDTFDVADASGLTGKNILYVTTSGVCSRSAGVGAPSVTVYLRISATDYSMGTLTCTQTTPTFSERTNMTRQFTNPNTGAAWTSADIDALQVKLDRSNASAREAYVTALQVIVAYEDALPTDAATNRQRSGGGN